MRPDQEEIDSGTLAALMLDLEENRLLRALRLMDRVNDGGLLTEEDIEFLKKVYEGSRANESLVERHPEYCKLIARSLGLYTEIITKGCAISLPLTGRYGNKPQQSARAQKYHLRRRSSQVSWVLFSSPQSKVAVPRGSTESGSPVIKGGVICRIGLVRCLLKNQTPC